MILYIENEIAAKFGTKSIIDDFRDLKRASSFILINVLKYLKNTYFVYYTLSTFL